ncbi:MAG TPA: HAMP domain-containing histidine kinase [Dehalococcoidia bacterium]|nr:HAMP domain-containing histidine kinase [Dehalococcoidia bacterium]
MKNPANLEREPSSARARQTLELISFLTHEFKTTLTSIITSAGLLVEELALSPDDTKAKLISNILASAHNLEARASELLNLTKLEAEGFHLELEPVDTNTIVYSVVDQLSPIVHSRDQSLTLNLAPRLPTIIADSLRVEQILLNLLSNATKFTPQGGSISLTVNRQNGYIVIEVQDSGPSIPLEEQHKIFQPYYQLKGDKEHILGIGLGLALCKHLVELHAGKIWVASEPGKGSTFAFSLPLGTSQEPVSNSQ